MTAESPPRLTAVSAEIGRGHPSYLDSVLTALGRSGYDPDRVSRATVRELARAASLPAWAAVKFLYRLGAMGGPATWLYNRLRAENNRPAAWQLSLLARGLKECFKGFEGICLVEHPLVAHILAPVSRVAYVHGEIAAPSLSAAPRAWLTLVPLEQTAARLEAYGVKREALPVTGLVIEPELTDVAETSFSARLRRLSPFDIRHSTLDIPLTVGFFTSGAWPRPHMQRIFTGVRSVLASGHRAVVFPGCDRKRIETIGKRLSLLAPVTLCGPSSLLGEKVEGDRCVLVCARTRQQETGFTAGHLPHLDVMVAAAHERTNWAVGLGLPLFCLLPHVGPFAPLNYRFARERGVCEPLASLNDARSLGPCLAELRSSGRLEAMARNGWGHLPIDGATNSARLILERAGKD